MIFAGRIIRDIRRVYDYGYDHGVWDRREGSAFWGNNPGDEPYRRRLFMRDYTFVEQNAYDCGYQDAIDDRARRRYI